MITSHNTFCDLDTIATSNPADRDKRLPNSPSIANMKAQLRTTLALAILAATLPAQTNDYDQALQRAGLIERQEGNLAAAEAAYTALLDDSKAPKAVHDAAYFQLAALMWRLGKRDDATKMLEIVVAGGGEFGGEAKALLESGSKEAQGKLDRVARARAIIKRYAEITSVGAVSDEHPLVAELRQLGEAAAQAITEELNVGPALRNNGTQLSGQGPAQLRFLCRQLWAIGTPPAQTFFDDAARTEPLPWQRFLTSGAGSVANDLAPSLLRFTQTVDPTREVWRNATYRLARHSSEAIAAALADGHEATREAGLVALSRRWVSMLQPTQEAFLAQHGTALRNVFAANQESMRTAKWDLLGKFTMLGTRPATMLFFEEIAKHPSEYRHVHNVKGNIPADDAWIRAAARAARAVAESEDCSVAKKAIYDLFSRQTPEWTKAVVDDLAAMVELGYTHGQDQNRWIRRYISQASTKQHQQLIAHLPEMHDVSMVAYQLATEHAVPELLPPLTNVLAQLAGTKQISWFDPKEASSSVQYLLLLAAACDRKNSGAVIADFAVAHPTQLPVTGSVLNELSMERNDEAARAGLRKLLVSDAYGIGKRAKELRNSILVELVRAGDATTIALLPKAYELGLARTHGHYTNLKLGDRSWQAPQTPSAGGLALITETNNRSTGWHGYTGKDAARAWQLLMDGPHADAAWDHFMDTNLDVPAGAMTVFAKQLAQRWHATKNDQRGLVARKIYKLSSLPDDALATNSELRETIAALVSDADDQLATLVFRSLPETIAHEFASEAMAGLQRGKSESWLAVMSSQNIPLSKDAWLAALAGDRDMCIAALHGLNKKADATLRSAVEAKLAHSHPDVRAAACTALVHMFGADAVPSILPLLQDGSSLVANHVRTQLTKLRELEEQRDFWDNKTGRTINTMSSAAKLISQAMPTEDKQQRVLAIRSLALLNAPEALPYLIDWTKDNDKDVQAAAKKAIAAMHQKGATDTPKPKK